MRHNHIHLVLIIIVIVIIIIIIIAIIIIIIIIKRGHGQLLFSIFSYFPQPDAIINTPPSKPFSL